MQSNQETVLEEFMQKSFGAQFLYLPKKYAKGTAQREPADLAWVAQNSVVLFYLRSSKEALADQIKHNRNQAAGYHRLWSTRKTSYALRGKNRFGDECFVPYNNVRYFLSILVVSEKCGVHFVPALTKDIASAVIVIPELLLHWIADFGGTIVDLLLLIDLCGAKETDGSTLSFSELSVLVEKYVAKAFAIADPERRYISGVAKHDFLFIKEHLSRMRFPASMANGIDNAESRHTISGIFGDLMLVEYANLAAVAEQAIEKSEPPIFKSSHVFKIQGFYYSFVIGTVHLGSKNAVEAALAMVSACKNEEGIVNSIFIQYGNFLDGRDYRTPLMMGLPPSLPRKHHEVIIEGIIALSLE